MSVVLRANQIFPVIPARHLVVAARMNFDFALFMKRSRQNSRTNRRNLATETRARQKYKFRPVIIGFIRCVHGLNHS
jgi:hypothetical protein